MAMRNQPLPELQSETPKEWFPYDRLPYIQSAVRICIKLPLSKSRPRQRFAALLAAASQLQQHCCCVCCRVCPDHSACSCRLVMRPHHLICHRRSCILHSPSILLLQQVWSSPYEDRAPLRWLCAAAPDSTCNVHTSNHIASCPWTVLTSTFVRAAPFCWG